MQAASAPRHSVVLVTHAQRRCGRGASSSRAVCTCATRLRWQAGLCGWVRDTMWRVWRAEKAPLSRAALLLRPGRPLAPQHPSSRSISAGAIQPPSKQHAFPAPHVHHPRRRRGRCVGHIALEPARVLAVTLRTGVLATGGSVTRSMSVWVRVVFEPITTQQRTAPHLTQMSRVRD